MSPCIRTPFFLSMAVLLVVAFACVPPAPGPRTSELILLYTGNAYGELERCGCSEQQMGGLSRRKTVIDQHRRENAVLVDAGDMFFESFGDRVGSQEFYAVKASAMIRSMNRMEYDAATLGDYDFAEGSDFLAGRIEEAAFPFVCANLVDPSGNLKVVPFRIVTRGGLRVALVGFLDSNVVTPAYREALGNLKIENPSAIAAKILPQLEGESDVIVALLHFHFIDAETFLRAFPQIDVAVLGHVHGDGTAVRMGRAVAVSGGDLGKEVGRLILQVGAGEGVARWSADLIPVREETAPDSGVQEEVTRFQQIVRERRFSEEIRFVRSSGEGNRYVGADPCVSCHPMNHQRWSATPHAFAFETLVDKGAEFNPECVVCHVVGYRDPSGFLGGDKTPHLAGVQCESCHGGAQAHLEGGAMKSGVTEQVCRTCHTEAHSPAFEPSLYLERANQCALQGE